MYIFTFILSTHDPYSPAFSYRICFSFIQQQLDFSLNTFPNDFLRRIQPEHIHITIVRAFQMNLTVFQRPSRKTREQENRVCLLFFFVQRPNCRIKEKDDDDVVGDDDGNVENEKRRRRRREIRRRRSRGRKK